MKIGFILAAFLLFLNPAFASEMMTGGISTGGFICDSQLQVVRWDNSGPPIKIKSVMFWIGAEMGTKADIAACLYKGSTTMQLSCVGWDRYANPNGLNQFTQTFSPDWITIETGDYLELQAWCNSFNVNDKHANVSVDFFYTTE